MFIPGFTHLENTEKTLRDSCQSHSEFQIRNLILSLRLSETSFICLVPPWFCSSSYLCIPIRRNPSGWSGFNWFRLWFWPLQPLFCSRQAAT